MLMNTLELTGAPLHYAVAHMLGAVMRPNSIDAMHAYLDGEYIGGFVTRTERGVSMPHDVFAPTHLAVYGAELGERVLEAHVASLTRTDDGWCAIAKGVSKVAAHGVSMRLAGLRAAVCDALGATVEIPDWLA